MHGTAIRMLVGSAVLSVAATTAAVAPATAAVWSAAAGTGFTQVTVDRYDHSLEIRQTVYQDNGGPQFVAGRVWVRRSATSTRAATAWVGGVWATNLTQQIDSGSFGQFNYGPFYDAAGSCFDVTAQYGWLRATGWYLSALEPVRRYCL